MPRQERSCRLRPVPLTAAVRPYDRHPHKTAMTWQTKPAARHFLRRAFERVVLQLRPGFRSREAQLIPAGIPMGPECKETTATATRPGPRLDLSAGESETA